MKYLSIRRKIIFDHLEKYPDASTRSLTHILSRDYPEFFEKYETTRSMIRVYRGANGVTCRRYTKTTKYYKNV